MFRLFIYTISILLFTFCQGLKPAEAFRIVKAGPGKLVQGMEPRGVRRTIRGRGVGPVLQDRTGYLWFSSNGNGAYRYDGQEWTNFSVDEGMAHPVVRAICEDRSGNLWFGTFGGVTRYDPSRTGQAGWTTFTRKDGLPDNAMLAVPVGRTSSGLESGLQNGRDFKSAGNCSPGIRKRIIIGQNLHPEIKCPASSE